MAKIFISRHLKTNSRFKAYLEEQHFEIIDQSLLSFEALKPQINDTPDWIFFYSKNGVKYFFNNPYFDYCLFLKQASTLKWASIGEGTADALRQKGITLDFVGNGHPNHVAETFKVLANAQKVGFVRALNSRKSIQKNLEKDLIILDLVLYKNEITRNFSIPFCEYLVFTSPLNVIAYFSKYTWQINQKIIAIGTTTAKALRESGHQKIIISKSPNEQALAEAILENLG